MAIHPECFTIMRGVSPHHHQCAASSWIMRWQPQDNSACLLTTHQLLVEWRDSDTANSVDGDDCEAMIC